MIIKVDKAVNKDKLLDVLFQAGYDVIQWEGGEYTYDIHSEPIDIKEDEPA